VSWKFATLGAHRIQKTITIRLDPSVRPGEFQSPAGEPDVVLVHDRADAEDALRTLKKLGLVAADATLDPEKGE